MSSKTLVNHRKSAFIAQSGHCFYCKLPMWESDVESFAKARKISPSQAKLFKCTAEHLKARKDGGKDTKQNIVAACHNCNQKRHHIKVAPSPDDYRQLVQLGLSSGCWHRNSLATRLT
jgi:5-methylcytosine-specific restriction endonuclease McrA